ncbi:MAG: hypothetical protein EOL97_06670 [Spirochaetia bacterium]|nr:hypothetical protein [Spirochaetia bacterium]
MAKVYSNNFSYGEISKRLYGRMDLDIYGKSVASLINFLPKIQGGIEKRMGTVEVDTLTINQGITRIIPYVYSANSSYLFLFSNNFLQIYKNDSLINTSQTDYAESELFEIQFAQNWDTLFLVHPNHPIQIIKHIGLDSFAYSELAFSTDEKHQDLFKSVNNYPSCVAFYANKLWLGSSITEPYTIWISKPVEVGSQISFEFYDVIQEESKEILPPPWEEGWEDDNSKIYTTKIINEEVITEANALKLVVGTSTNDKIMWFSPAQYMFVGTASSEWIIPANINAQQYTISKISGYGSANIQALMANNEILYIQSDKKRLRTYSYSSNGASGDDLTFTCDHIFESGVKEFAWQRVPEPMGYFVLNNGEMVVLSLNRQYGQQAWSHIEIEGIIESVCVLDSDEGQEVYIITLREGERRLERFDFNSFTDCSNTLDIPFLAKLVTNPFESKTSLGEIKSGWKVLVKLYDSSEFLVGFLGSRLEKARGDVFGNYEANLFTPLNPTLQLVLESLDDNPLSILAILTNLEV